jgi:hypothetical protein
MHILTLNFLNQALIICFHLWILKTWLHFIIDVIVWVALTFINLNFHSFIKINYSNFIYCCLFLHVVVELLACNILPSIYILLRRDSRSISNPYTLDELVLREGVSIISTFLFVVLQWYFFCNKNIKK